MYFDETKDLDMLTFMRLCIGVATDSLEIASGGASEAAVASLEQNKAKLEKLYAEFATPRQIQDVEHRIKSL